MDTSAYATAWARQRNEALENAISANQVTDVQPTTPLDLRDPSHGDSYDCSQISERECNATGQRLNKLSGSTWSASKDGSHIFTGIDGNIFPGAQGERWGVRRVLAETTPKVPRGSPTGKRYEGISFDQDNKVVEKAINEFPGVVPMATECVAVPVGLNDLVALLRATVDPLYVTVFVKGYQLHRLMYQRSFASEGEEEKCSDQPIEGRKYDQSVSGNPIVIGDLSGQSNIPNMEMGQGMDPFPIGKDQAANQQEMMRSECIMLSQGVFMTMAKDARKLSGAPEEAQHIVVAEAPMAWDKQVQRMSMSAERVSVNGKSVDPEALANIYSHQAIFAVGKMADAIKYIDNEGVEYHIVHMEVRDKENILANEKVRAIAKTIVYGHWQNNEARCSDGILMETIEQFENTNARIDPERRKFNAEYWKKYPLRCPTGKQLKLLKLYLAEKEKQRSWSRAEEDYYRDNPPEYGRPGKEQRNAQDHYVYHPPAVPVIQYYGGNPVADDGKTRTRKQAQRANSHGGRIFEKPYAPQGFGTNEEYSHYTRETTVMVPGKFGDFRDMVPAIEVTVGVVVRGQCHTYRAPHSKAGQTVYCPGHDGVHSNVYPYVLSMPKYVEMAEFVYRIIQRTLSSTVRTFYDNIANLPSGRGDIAIQVLRMRYHNSTDTQRRAELERIQLRPPEKGITGHQLQVFIADALQQVRALATDPTQVLAIQWPVFRETIGRCLIDDPYFKDVMEKLLVHDLSIGELLEEVLKLDKTADITRRIDSSGNRTDRHRYGGSKTQWRNQRYSRSGNLNGGQSDQFRNRNVHPGAMNQQYTNSNWTPHGNHGRHQGHSSAAPAGYNNRQKQRNNRANVNMVTGGGYQDPKCDHCRMKHAKGACTAPGSKNYSASATLQWSTSFLIAASHHMPISVFQKLPQSVLSKIKDLKDVNKNALPPNLPDFKSNKATKDAYRRQQSSKPTGKGKGKGKGKGRATPGWASNEPSFGRGMNNGKGTRSGGTNGHVNQGRGSATGRGKGRGKGAQAVNFTRSNLNGRGNQNGRGSAGGRGSGKGSARGGKGSSQGIRCYKCQGLGHTAPNCRSPGEDQDKAMRKANSTQGGKPKHGFANVKTAIVIPAIVHQTPLPLDDVLHFTPSSPTMRGLLYEGTLPYISLQKEDPVGQLEPIFDVSGKVFEEAPITYLQAARKAIVPSDAHQSDGCAAVVLSSTPTTEVDKCSEFEGSSGTLDHRTLDNGNGASLDYKFSEGTQRLQTADSTASDVGNSESDVTSPMIVDSCCSETMIRHASSYDIADDPVQEPFAEQMTERGGGDDAAQLWGHVQTVAEATGALVVMIARSRAYQPSIGEFGTGDKNEEWEELATARTHICQIMQQGDHYRAINCVMETVSKDIIDKQYLQKGGGITTQSSIGGTVVEQLFNSVMLGEVERGGSPYLWKYFIGEVVGFDTSCSTDSPMDEDIHSLCEQFERYPPMAAWESCPWADLLYEPYKRALMILNDCWPSDGAVDFANSLCDEYPELRHYILTHWSRLACAVGRIYHGESIHYVTVASSSTDSTNQGVILAEYCGDTYDEVVQYTHGSGSARDEECDFTQPMIDIEEPYAEDDMDSLWEDMADSWKEMDELLERETARNDANPADDSCVIEDSWKAEAEAFMSEEKLRVAGAIPQPKSPLPLLTVEVKDSDESDRGSTCSSEDGLSLESNSSECEDLTPLMFSPPILQQLDVASAFMCASLHVESAGVPQGEAPIDTMESTGHLPFVDTKLLANRPLGEAPLLKVKGKSDVNDKTQRDIAGGDREREGEGSQSDVETEPCLWSRNRAAIAIQAAAKGMFVRRLLMGPYMGLYTRLQMVNKNVDKWPKGWGMSGSRRSRSQLMRRLAIWSRMGHFDKDKNDVNDQYTYVEWIRRQIGIVGVPEVGEWYHDRVAYRTALCLSLPMIRIEATIRSIKPLMNSLMWDDAETALRTLSAVEVTRVMRRLKIPLPGPADESNEGACARLQRMVVDNNSSENSRQKYKRYCSAARAIITGVLHSERARDMPICQYIDLAQTELCFSEHFEGLLFDSFNKPVKVQDYEGLVYKEYKLRGMNTLKEVGERTIRQMDVELRQRARHRTRDMPEKRVMNLATMYVYEAPLVREGKVHLANYLQTLDKVLGYGHQNTYRREYIPDYPLNWCLSPRFLAAGDGCHDSPLYTACRKDNENHREFSADFSHLTGRTEEETPWYEYNFEDHFNYGLDPDEPMNEWGVGMRVLHILGSITEIQQHLNIDSKPLPMLNVGAARAVRKSIVFILRQVTIKGDGYCLSQLVPTMVVCPDEYNGVGQFVIAHKLIAMNSIDPRYPRYFFTEARYQPVHGDDQPYRPYVNMFTISPMMTLEGVAQFLIQEPGTVVMLRKDWKDRLLNKWSGDGTGEATAQLFDDGRKINVRHGTAMDVHEDVEVQGATAISYEISKAIRIMHSNASRNHGRLRSSDIVGVYRVISYYTSQFTPDDQLMVTSVRMPFTEANSHALGLLANFLDQDGSGTCDVCGNSLCSSKESRSHGYGAHQREDEPHSESQVMMCVFRAIVAGYDEGFLRVHELLVGYALNTLSIDSINLMETSPWGNGHLGSMIWSELIAKKHDGQIPHGLQVRSSRACSVPGCNRRIDQCDVERQWNPVYGHEPTCDHLKCMMFMLSTKEAVGPPLLVDHNKEADYDRIVRIQTIQQVLHQGEGIMGFRQVIQRSNHWIANASRDSERQIFERYFGSLVNSEDGIAFSRQLGRRVPTESNQNVVDVMKALVTYRSSFFATQDKRGPGPERTRISVSPVPNGVCRNAMIRHKDNVHHKPSRRQQMWNMILLTYRFYQMADSVETHCLRQPWGMTEAEVLRATVQIQCMMRGWYVRVMRRKRGRRENYPLDYPPGQQNSNHGITTPYMHPNAPSNDRPANTLAQMQENVEIGEIGELLAILVNNGDSDLGASSGAGAPLSPIPVARPIAAVMPVNENNVARVASVCRIDLRDAPGRCRSQSRHGRESHHRRHRQASRREVPRGGNHPASRNRVTRRGNSPGRGRGKGGRRNTPRRFSGKGGDRSTNSNHLNRRGSYTIAHPTEGHSQRCPCRQCSSGPRGSEYSWRNSAGASDEVSPLDIFFGRGNRGSPPPNEYRAPVTGMLQNAPAPDVAARVGQAQSQPVRGNRNPEIVIRGNGNIIVMGDMKDNTIDIRTNGNSQVEEPETQAQGQAAVLISTCDLDGCDKPQFNENGRVHNYCCRTHAQRDLQRNRSMDHSNEIQRPNENAASEPDDGASVPIGEHEAPDNKIVKDHVAAIVIQKIFRGAYARSQVTAMMRKAQIHLCMSFSAVVIQRHFRGARVRKVNAGFHHVDDCLLTGCTGGPNWCTGVPPAIIREPWMHHVCTGQDCDYIHNPEDECKICLRPMRLHQMLHDDCSMCPHRCPRVRTQAGIFESSSFSVSRATWPLGRFTINPDEEETKEDKSDQETKDEEKDDYHESEQEGTGKSAGNENMPTSSEKDVNTRGGGQQENGINPSVLQMRCQPTRKSRTEFFDCMKSLHQGLVITTKTKVSYHHRMRLIETRLSNMKARKIGKILCALGHFEFKQLGFVKSVTRTRTKSARTKLCEIMCNPAYHCANVPHYNRALDYSTRNSHASRQLRRQCEVMTTPFQWLKGTLLYMQLKEYSEEALELDIYELHPTVIRKIMMGLGHKRRNRGGQKQKVTTIHTDRSMADLLCKILKGLGHFRQVHLYQQAGPTQGTIGHQDLSEQLVTAFREMNAEHESLQPVFVGMLRNTTSSPLNLGRKETCADRRLFEYAEYNDELYEAVRHHTLKHEQQGDTGAPMCPEMTRYLADFKIKVDKITYNGPANLKNGFAQDVVFHARVVNISGEECYSLDPHTLPMAVKELMLTIINQAPNADTGESQTDVGDWQTQAVADAEGLDMSFLNLQPSTGELRALLLRKPEHVEHADTVTRGPIVNDFSSEKAPGWTAGYVNGVCKDPRVISGSMIQYSYRSPYGHTVVTVESMVSHEHQMFNLSTSHSALSDKNAEGIVRTSVLSPRRTLLSRVHASGMQEIQHMQSLHEAKVLESQYNRTAMQRARQYHCMLHSEHNACRKNMNSGIRNDSMRYIYARPFGDVYRAKEDYIEEVDSLWPESGHVKKQGDESADAFRTWKIQIPITKWTVSRSKLCDGRVAYQMVAKCKARTTRTANQRRVLQLFVQYEGNESNLQHLNWKTACAQQLWVDFVDDEDNVRFFESGQWIMASTGGKYPDIHDRCEPHEPLTYIGCHGIDANKGRVAVSYAQTLDRKEDEMRQHAIEFQKQDSMGTHSLQIYIERAWPVVFKRILVEHRRTIIRAVIRVYGETALQDDLDFNQGPPDDDDIDTKGSFHELYQERMNILQKELETIQPGDEENFDLDLLSMEDEVMIGFGDLELDDLDLENVDNGKGKVDNMTDEGQDVTMRTLESLLGGHEGEEDTEVFNLCKESRTGMPYLTSKSRKSVELESPRLTPPKRACTPVPKYKLHDMVWCTVAMQYQIPAKIIYIGRGPVYSIRYKETETRKKAVNLNAVQPVYLVHADTATRSQILSRCALARAFNDASAMCESRIVTANEGKLEEQSVVISRSTASTPQRGQQVIIPKISPDSVADFGKVDDMVQNTTAALAHMAVDAKNRLGTIRDETSKKCMSKEEEIALIRTMVNSTNTSKHLPPASIENMGMMADSCATDGCTPCVADCARLRRTDGTITFEGAANDPQKCPFMGDVVLSFKDTCGQYYTQNVHNVMVSPHFNHRLLPMIKTVEGASPGTCFTISSDKDRHIHSELTIGMTQRGISEGCRPISIPISIAGSTHHKYPAMASSDIYIHRDKKVYDIHDKATQEGLSKEEIDEKIIEYLLSKTPGQKYSLQNPADWTVKGKAVEKRTQAAGPDMVKVMVCRNTQGSLKKAAAKEEENGHEVERKRVQAKIAARSMMDMASSGERLDEMAADSMVDMASSGERFALTNSRYDNHYTEQEPSDAVYQAALAENLGCTYKPVAIAAYSMTTGNDIWQAPTQEQINPVPAKNFGKEYTNQLANDSKRQQEIAGLTGSNKKVYEQALKGILEDSDKIYEYSTEHPPGTVSKRRQEWELTPEEDRFKNMPNLQSQSHRHLLDTRRRCAHGEEPRTAFLDSVYDQCKHGAATKEVSRQLVDAGKAGAQVKSMMSTVSNNEPFKVLVMGHSAASTAVALIKLQGKAIIHGFASSVAYPIAETDGNDVSSLETSSIACYGDPDTLVDRMAQDEHLNIKVCETDVLDINMETFRGTGRDHEAKEPYSRQSTEMAKNECYDANGKEAFDMIARLVKKVSPRIMLLRTPTMEDTIVKSHSKMRQQIERLGYGVVTKLMNTAQVQTVLGIATPICKYIHVTIAVQGITHTSKMPPWPNTNTVFDEELYHGSLKPRMNIHKNEYIDESDVQRKTEAISSCTTPKYVGVARIQGKEKAQIQAITHPIAAPYPPNSWNTSSDTFIDEAGVTRRILEEEMLSMFGFDRSIRQLIAKDVTDMHLFLPNLGTGRVITLQQKVSGEDMTGTWISHMSRQSIELQTFIGRLDPVQVIGELWSTMIIPMLEKDRIRAKAFLTMVQETKSNMMPTVSRQLGETCSDFTEAGNTASIRQVMQQTVKDTNVMRRMVAAQTEDIAMAFGKTVLLEDRREDMQHIFMPMAFLFPNLPNSSIRGDMQHDPQMYQPNLHLMGVQLLAMSEDVENHQHQIIAEGMKQSRELYENKHGSQSNYNFVPQWIYTYPADATNNIPDVTFKVGMPMQFTNRQLPLLSPGSSLPAMGNDMMSIMYMGFYDQTLKDSIVIDTTNGNIMKATRNIGYRSRRTDKKAKWTVSEVHQSLKFYTPVILSTEQVSKLDDNDQWIFEARAGYNVCSTHHRSPANYVRKIQRGDEEIPTSTLTFPPRLKQISSLKNRATLRKGQELTQSEIGRQRLEQKKTIKANITDSVDTPNFDQDFGLDSNGPMVLATAHALYFSTASAAVDNMLPDEVDANLACWQEATGVKADSMSTQPCVGRAVYMHPVAIERQKRVHLKKIMAKAASVRLPNEEQAIQAMRARGDLVDDALHQCRAIIRAFQIKSPVSLTLLDRLHRTFGHKSFSAIAMWLRMTYPGQKHNFAYHPCSVCFENKQIRSRSSKWQARKKDQLGFWSIDIVVIDKSTIETTNDGQSDEDESSGDDDTENQYCVGYVAKEAASCVIAARLRFDNDSSTTIEVLQSIRQEMQRYNIPFNHIASDRGEMATPEVKAWITEQGWTSELTTSGESKENAVAEHSIYILTDMVRCMLANAGLVQNFKHAAWAHAQLILNHWPSEKLRNLQKVDTQTELVPMKEAKRLVEKEGGKMYAYQDELPKIHVFGCLAYTLITNRAKRGGKLYKVARPCIYLGRATDTKDGHYLIDPATRSKICARHVAFDDLNISIVLNSTNLELIRKFWTIKKQQNQELTPAPPPAEYTTFAYQQGGNTVFVELTELDALRQHLVASASGLDTVIESEEDCSRYLPDDMYETYDHIESIRGMKDPMDSRVKLPSEIIGNEDIIRVCQEGLKKCSDYIAVRVTNIDGMTVEEAKNASYDNAKGINVKYKLKDLRYDIKHKRVRLIRAHIAVLKVSQMCDEKSMKQATLCTNFQLATDVMIREAPQNVNKASDDQNADGVARMAAAAVISPTDEVYWTRPGHEPKSEKDIAALPEPSRTCWERAMFTEERNQLCSGSYDLIPKTLAAPFPAPREVLETKTKEFPPVKGVPSLDKLKVRVCHNGSDSTEGIHHLHKIVTTLGLTTYKVFLAVCVLKKLFIEQGDATAAYLHAPNPFPMFSTPVLSRFTYKTKEGIPMIKYHRTATYGGAASGGLWQEHFERIIIEMGFTKLKSVDAVYMYEKDGEVMIVAIYVDDIIAGHNSTELCTWFKIRVAKGGIEVKWSGELKWFLNHSLVRDYTADTLHVSQADYITTAAKAHQCDGFKKMDFPDEMHITTDQVPTTPEEIQESQEILGEYQSLIGKIGWCYAVTCPMIGFLLNKLQSVQNKPMKQHMNQAKRLLGYLYQIRDMGMTFHGPDSVYWKEAWYKDSGSSQYAIENRDQVIYFYDANHTTLEVDGAHPQVCNQGYLAGVCVINQCHQMKLTGGSTMHSESCAAYDAALSAVAVRRFLNELRVYQRATTAYGDNQAQVIVATRDVESKNTKAWFFMRASTLQDLHRINIIDWRKVDTNSNPADIGTKGFLKEKFASFAAQMTGQPAIYAQGSNVLTRHVAQINKAKKREIFERTKDELLMHKHTQGTHILTARELQQIDDRREREEKRFTKLETMVNENVPFSKGIPPLQGAQFESFDSVGRR